MLTDISLLPAKRNKKLLFIEKTKKRAIKIIQDIISGFLT